MSEKPTIQEIAAMPYPASLLAMRQHYNPMWGKDIGDGVKKKWRVSVDVEIRTTESVEVEAFTKDEAEELACDKAADRFDDPSEVECTAASARQVGDA